MREATIPELELQLEAALAQRDVLEDECIKLAKLVDTLLGTKGMLEASRDKAEQERDEALETIAQKDRVIAKLREQRDCAASDYQHQILYYDKPKYINECIEVQIEQYDAELAALEKDDAVVQINHGDGYYTHHKAIFQSGHPGHEGIVIHAGEQIAAIEKDGTK